MEGNSHLAPIDLIDTYAHFNSDEQFTTVPADAFWKLQPEVLNRDFGHLLVSSFSFDKPWATWEMHPAGDELIAIVKGEATMVLELPTGNHHVKLRAGQTLIMPKGIWHTALADTPCVGIFLTAGTGTQSRPVDQTLSLAPIEG